VTFRNLAWSGDNVFGHARVGFDNPGSGFGRIEKRLTEAKPTVVVLGYGMNASFAGAAGLESYLGGLDRLLALIDRLGARVVLLGPLRHENLGAPLPDPAAHNRQLELYIEATRKVARKRGAVFVDLYRLLGDGTVSDAGMPYTDNGIHLTDYGYWTLSGVISRSLGLTPPRWSLDIDVAKRSVEAQGARCDKVQIARSSARVEVTDLALPPPPPPEASSASRRDESRRTLRVRGLSAGSYVIEAGDRTVAKASAADLARGISITDGPETRQVERLRGTIARKNFLFFHRWRPQNNTYLFLFRKHEQGDLAGEVDEFVPLIEHQERIIAELCTPVTRTYIVRREEAR